MKWTVIAVLVLAIAPPAHGGAGKTVTWTGWFSDKDCATPRVEKGDISPNGTACVKKCLEKGVTPVFVSQQAKALFEVKNYPGVAEDVGWKIEVTGVVDEKAGTIEIASVKRLSEFVNMCALPKKEK